MNNLRIIKKENGTAMAFIILVLAVFIVTVASATFLLSIENSKVNDINNRGLMNEELNKSCLSEALLRLKTDKDYSGENLALEEGECNIQVTQNGDLRQIVIRSNIRDLTLMTTTEASLETDLIKINYTKRGMP